MKRIENYLNFSYTGERKKAFYDVLLENNALLQHIRCWEDKPEKKQFQIFTDSATKLY